MNLGCACPGQVKLDDGERLIYHVELESWDTGGAHFHVVRCPNPATEEDGLCDACRAHGHVATVRTFLSDWAEPYPDIPPT